MGFGGIARKAVILGALGLSGIGLSGLSTPILAQSPDISPVLLIETGPSDNPNYRRMVFVKYLVNGRVSVAYKAYNRTEFIQIPDSTPASLVRSCTAGPAATLQDIRAYQYAESVARRQNMAPVITHFCVKNVPSWEAGNRATYLDPIFEGLPQSARLIN